jgi:hypothetical protein
MGTEPARCECGCIPGELCCQRATDASRRLRDLLSLALKDGDWQEFDALRAWLVLHHFGTTEVRESTVYRIA